MAARWSGHGSRTRKSVDAPGVSKSEIPGPIQCGGWDPLSEGEGIGALTVFSCVVLLSVCIRRSAAPRKTVVCRAWERSYEEAYLLQCLPHELRRPPVARPVGARRRPHDRLHRPRRLGRTRQAAGTRQVRRDLPGRRARGVRRVSRQSGRRGEDGHAGAGQRSDAAHSRYGLRHAASRVRLHEFDAAKPPVHVRAARFDARPSHQGARRLEHRNLLSRKRRPQLRPRRLGRTRPAL